jgi:hypothetical protein
MPRDLNLPSETKLGSSVVNLNRVDPVGLDSESATEGPIISRKTPS